MNPTALRYALRHVTTWLVLGIGGFYAYLATLGGPNLTIHTIGATALITTAVCIFASRYRLALEVQVWERQAQDRERAAALVAESRAIRNLH